MIVDEARLQEIEEEDRRQQAAARRRRRILSVLGGALALAFVVLMGMSAYYDAKRGHELVIIGRQDTDVRVEIEGREPALVQARGVYFLRPEAPGPLRLRFTASATDESFERVLDVPPPGSDGDAVLAVPTREDECFAAFDVTGWYGESQSLMEIVADRAEGRAAPGSGSLPPAALVARIRLLDPLPSRYFTRPWALPSLLGEDDQVLVLVGLPCAQLEQGDSTLAARLREQVSS